MTGAMEPIAIVGMACRFAGADSPAEFWRIAPAEVDYVEAHGTGTEVGDPVEANATGAAYGGLRARKARRPAAADRLGEDQHRHLESAAGVAGEKKVVLAMQQGVPARSRRV